ncbi:MAG: DNA-3-methyladenine glycosylase [Verrucomicrobiales bacterium]|nr:DNA-3-methyladenine glycosylase [Verrucomicrobiales bacterium]
MSFAPAHIRVALKHLRSADPVLDDLIERVGPFRMKVDRDRFRSLVGSIISQQISGSAARSIRARLEQLVAPRKIAPETIGRLSPEQLRGAGLSGQKTRYLVDLATKVERQEVRLKSVARMPDDAVIEELVQVKGIGVWTAQMFLMFSLGRMDVFPHNDLGIRSALRNLYDLEELPDKETSHRIAAPWRPYATMACWYCWRSLELSKSKAKAAVG